MIEDDLTWPGSFASYNSSWMTRFQTLVEELFVSSIFTSFFFLFFRVLSYFLTGTPHFSDFFPFAFNFKSLFPLSKYLILPLFHYNCYICILSSFTYTILTVVCEIYVQKTIVI